MKTTLSLLIVLITLGAFAQGESRWKWSVGFAPGIGYRNLSNTASENEIFDMIIETRNITEEPQFQWGSSLLISYTFWNRFDLSSGVEYGNYGQLSRNIQLTPTQEFPLDEFEYSTLNENYNFIGIPLNIGYQLPIGKRFSFRAEVGAGVMNFFNYHQRYSYKYINIEESENTVDQKPVDDTVNEANVWNYQISFSLGLVFNLGEHSNISVQPFYSLLVKPMYASPILGNYFKGGLSFKYSREF